MMDQKTKRVIITGVIAGATSLSAIPIKSWFEKKEPLAHTVTGSRIESKAETKGDQSPALAGSDGATITYGEPKMKQEQAEAK